MRSFLILIMISSFVTLSYASSLDEIMRDKGYSYAPSTDGKAPIYQILSTLQQAVQQNNVDLVSSLLTPDPSRRRAVDLIQETETQLTARFQSDRNRELTIGGSAPGWKTTGFRDFGFHVDSITITGDAATLPAECRIRLAQNRPLLRHKDR